MGQSDHQPLSRCASRLFYATMILSTYMYHPIKTAYDSLWKYTTLSSPSPTFAYHVSHKHLNKSPLCCHFQKGQGEITNIKDYVKLQAYHDSDLALDVVTRRSVNASVHEINGVELHGIAKSNPW